jgi:shikimate kinase/3-dehydroquinate synthase
VLVFIGFMGAGKSTAARALGGVDTDAVLVERLGEPIEAFFDREGEAAFRAREEEVVLEVLASGVPVVALGGGAVLSERVQAALRDHVVVWLEVDGELAWRRAGGRGRPNARDRAGFHKRLAQRAPVYERIADAFVPVPGEIPVAALRALRKGQRLLWARAASGEYPVWLGRPPEREDGDFWISDANVGPLHAPDAFAIPAGEEHKTLATAESVWERMTAEGITRTGRVVAVGGGVVGDLAGFCAATYQRGIPVVHVPTTVVAQVDSAYGGKTGVDLPAAKNYVGAYHLPQAVHVLPETLESLPAAERAAGYAEVLKTALIAGGTLWERVAAGAAYDPETVLACARTKLAVVAADERDGGRRQVLNLGHTVGHALEVALGYGVLRHGEAVGLGMLAALRLSGQDALRQQVGELLAGHGLPVRAPVALDAAQIAQIAQRDKKRVGEEVPFVLVRAPGDVTEGHAVGRDDLLAAVRELTR